MPLLLVLLAAAAPLLPLLVALGPLPRLLTAAAGLLTAAALRPLPRPFRLRLPVSLKLAPKMKKKKSLTKMYYPKIFENLVFKFNFILAVISYPSNILS